MDGQKFCLKWDGFQGSVTAVFDSLRQDGELVDVTLCCEGHRVQAHRMLLSACSPYFRDLLKSNPCQQLVIFLKDTSPADLTAIVEFMYKGTVNVSQSQLGSFIKTAEMLQIKGLSGEDEKTGVPPPPSPRRPTAAPAATPPAKRRRLSGSDSGRRSPGSPGQRPRTPTPPPGPPLAPPPPPPPPPAAAPPAMEDLPLDPAPPHQDMPQPPLQPQETVKVEKVDLTEEEDEASLDSTLCHVAEYEGGYDGSNQGLDQMPLLSAAELGGLPPLGAGPSQPQPPRHAGLPGAPGGPPAEDGAGSENYRCETCGRCYSSRVSLKHHSKMHSGVTTCALCGRVSSRVADLRTHLRVVHGLTVPEIRAMVPTREKYHLLGPDQMPGQWQKDGRE